MTSDLKSKPLKLDSLAPSRTHDKPPFLSKPKGAPVYHGFPLIEETLTDGWRFGAITEFEDPEGCEEGDGFVEAPNGDRAGLVWDVGHGEISEISPPDDERWGVYQVWFSRPIKAVEDLVFNFRSILPQMKELYRKVKGAEEQIQSK